MTPWKSTLSKTFFATLTGPMSNEWISKFPRIWYRKTWFCILLGDCVKFRKCVTKVFLLKYQYRSITHRPSLQSSKGAFEVFSLRKTVRKFVFEVAVDRYLWPWRHKQYKT